MRPAAVAASGGITSAEELLQAARVILDNCGVPMSHSKLSRLVRAFSGRVERNGFAFFDFLANAVVLTVEQRRTALANPDIQRVISYSDPTGETAVANVMQAR